MKKTLYNQYFLTLVIVTIGFQIIYGLGILNPTNIDWLMSAYHDWGQHYLGWAFFRSEDWHLPLGHIQNFNYPAGTNVGYTDSIPLLAIFFKTFSFLLPETFQYYGIWLFSCHFLIAYFTVKILEIYKVKTVYLLLAVVLVSFNPILIYRSMHPALCAHWLVLASIYLYLKPVNSLNVRTNLRNQIVLIAMSALINPYLFFMIAGFGIILPFKNYYFTKLLSIKELIVYTVLPFLLVVILWFCVGMISFDEKVDMEVVNSYGMYSFNLNSLWNSEGFSTLLPQLKKATVNQYEGYGYLGLGLLVLAASAIVLSFLSIKKISKNKFLLPLLVITILYLLFAITNIVTFGEQTLFTYYIPELLVKLGGVFRACGRFAWLLYYSIILFSILIFVKSKISNSAKIVVLSILTLVQLYDIKPMLFSKNLPYGNYKNEKLSQDKWLTISSNFKRIVTYQPFDNNLGYPLSYQDLCFIALQNKLPITCGYVARATSNDNNKYTDSLNINLSEGIISNDELYITSPKDVDNFSAVILKNKAKIRYLDGFYYIYSADKSIKINTRQTPLEKFKVDSLTNYFYKANKVTVVDKPVFETEKINSNLEKNSNTDNVIQLQGWAFLKETSNNTNDSIFVLLTSDKNTYLFKTKSFKRPDITTAYKKENLENAGFMVTIFKEKIAMNNYKLALAIKKNNKYTYQLLDQPELSLFKKNPPKYISKIPAVTTNIIGNVEKITDQAGSIFIDGWSAVENQDATKSIIKIILKGKNANYEIETDVKMRQDVTNAKKADGNYNYNESGFLAKIKKSLLEKDNYTIGVFIKDKNNKESFILTDKKIEVK